MGLQFAGSGWIVGYRFYRYSDDTGEVMMWLETSPIGCQPMRPAKIPPNGGFQSSNWGWQHVYFHPRWPISNGNRLWVCAWCREGIFGRNAGDLVLQSIVNGDVTTLQTGIAGPNAMYSSDSILCPRTDSGGGRWGIDVLYHRTGN
jgi:hypothetical protein